jgi:hypothetical protein
MTAGIAVDDRFVSASELRARQSVHQHEVGRHVEPQQRAPHREDRGAPDVESVDLPHARGADADSEGAGAHDPRESRPLDWR